MTKRIGILTSGGDCAGLNAVIRAVTLRAHYGHGWTTIGIGYGTQGLMDRPINARELEFKATPLAAAVRSCCSGEDPKLAECRRRMVEFLLKRGAATNLPGDEPWATPLAWARERGLTVIEEVLMKHGAT